MVLGVIKSVLPLLTLILGLAAGYVLAVNLQPSKYDVELIMHTSNTIRAGYEQKNLMDIAESGIHMRCKLMQRIEFNHTNLKQTDQNYFSADAKKHAQWILRTVVENYDSEDIQRELTRCQR